MPAPEEIPFDYRNRNGNKVKELVPHLWRGSNRDTFDIWEQNIPFYGTVRIDTFSGKNIRVIHEETGTVYWISPMYLVELVNRVDIKNSCVVGTWQVFKQGSAHFLRLTD